MSNINFSRILDKIPKRYTKLNTDTKTILNVLDNHYTLSLLMSQGILSFTAPNLNGVKEVLFIFNHEVHVISICIIAKLEDGKNIHLPDVIIKDKDITFDEKTVFDIIVSMMIKRMSELEIRLRNKSEVDEINSANKSNSYIPKGRICYTY